MRSHPMIEERYDGRPITQDVWSSVARYGDAIITTTCAKHAQCKTRTMGQLRTFHLHTRPHAMSTTEQRASIRADALCAHVDQRVRLIEDELYAEAVSRNTYSWLLTPVRPVHVAVPAHARARIRALARALSQDQADRAAAIFHATAPAMLPYELLPSLPDAMISALATVCEKPVHRVRSNERIHAQIAWAVVPVARKLTKLMSAGLAARTVSGSAAPAVGAVLPFSHGSGDAIKAHPSLVIHKKIIAEQPRTDHTVIHIPGAYSGEALMP